MQLLVDFLPIIVFVAVYKLYGAMISASEAMYAATAAIMIVMPLQVLYQWLRKRVINKMLLISGVLVLIFGGITLIVHNAVFIQWKLTIANWLFAVAFLVSRYFGEKTLIERILGEAIELPQTMWRRLNLLWVANFALFGTVNLYVLYNYSEEAWVNFKFYGILGFNIVMVVIQGIWIYRYLPEERETNS